MKFHTNLPPSECLKRISSPAAMKPTIKSKYAPYFSKNPDQCQETLRGYKIYFWHKRIHTDVDADRFEVAVKSATYNTKYDKGRPDYMSGNKIKVKYSGTIVENEAGGSTVEFHITCSAFFQMLYFFIIVMLIGLIVMLMIGVIEDPPMPGYCSGISKMVVMQLFLVLGLLSPSYVMEMKSRRLVVEFIKDLLEINGHQIVVDENEQAKQPVLRLKKKQTGKHK